MSALHGGRACLEKHHPPQAGPRVHRRHQPKDIASIRDVIHQVRKELPQAEFLLATGAFGTTDPRDEAALAKASHSGSGAYGRALGKLAAEERCAYLDMTTPWASTSVPQSSIRICSIVTPFMPTNMANKSWPKS